MQILAFALVVLLIIFAIGAKRSSLEKKKKVIIFILFLMLIVLIVSYEIMIKSRASKNRILLNYFEQGKVLICNSYEVDKEHFNYEFGTSSFLAKPKFQNLSGLVLAIEDCKEKP